MFLAFFVLLIGNSAWAQRPIAVQGSDTLIYLGQRFAEVYQRRSSETSLQVRGGGVAHALTAVASGQADVAQGEGIAPAGKSSMSFPIAVQGIVVYVNQSNPVHELTMAQLRSIFLGEITNWKALNGPDSEIHLYAGESSTGTLAYFQDDFLRGQDPYPFVGKSNTQGLLEEIAAHKEAIGYGSLGAAAGVGRLLSSRMAKPRQSNPASRAYARAATP